MENLERLMELLFDIRERYGFWEKWYFEHDEAFIEEVKDFPDRFYDDLFALSFYQDDDAIDEAIDYLHNAMCSAWLRSR